MKDKGFLDQLSGKAKVAIGKMTDDEKMIAQGRLEQAIGKVKEVAGDVKDAAEEVVDKAKEKMDQKEK